MKVDLKILAFALLLLLQKVVLGQEPFLCTGQGFLTMNVDGQSSLVELRISPHDGSLHFDTISSDMGIFVNSVGFNPVDRFIYGIDPVRYTLYQIDARGQARSLAELPLDNALNYLAGDITSDGRFLYLLGASGGIEGFDRDLVRVDLTVPTYPLQVIPFQNDERIRIFDLAIDQGDSVAYAFDSSNDRLCTFDLRSGKILTRFPTIENVETIGAIYFDAFGRLFGFGSMVGPQNTLFGIDIHTGHFELLASGLPSQNTDGCSCSYGLDLEKRATPRNIATCDSILIQYTFANRTGFDQKGLALCDSFPYASRIKTVRFLGAMGSVREGPGSANLNVVDISLPRGYSSIEVVVLMPAGTGGSYGSYALLKNLPARYGEERRSDDPETRYDFDKTRIQVSGLSQVDSVTQFQSICNSHPVILSGPTIDGASYIWSMGDDGSQVTVSSAGQYDLRVSLGCDTSMYIYHVMESRVGVIKETFVNQNQDDSLWIEPQVEHQLPLHYQWSAESGIQISCRDCPSTWIHGSDGGEVKFIAIDELGCSDSTFFVFENQKVDYFVPNAFSPNGDGVNDYLEFYFREEIDEIKVLIFDRYGRIIYGKRGTTASTHWDGSNGKDEASEAVYVWVLQWIDLSGMKRHASGEVLLIR